MCGLQAQYLIFEKMREEGFVAGTDDVRLTVEILVPSSQVGRIIGKGGQNVRELQRVTGSIIKLPEQGASPPSQDEETTVHIIGPFFSVQVCINNLDCWHYLQYTTRSVGRRTLALTDSQGKEQVINFKYTYIVKNMLSQ